MSRLFNSEDGKEYGTSVEETLPGAELQDLLSATTETVPAKRR